jgi:pyruvate formate lyase activating enzyme
MKFGIKGFIKLSFIDWPGKIASVIFLGGCNFRCPACHNSDLVLNQDALDDMPFASCLDTMNQRGRWIDGVTVTGGEPTLNPNLIDLLEMLKSNGLSVKLDTNGSRPQILKQILAAGLVDAVFMDVKAPLTTEEYSRITGIKADLTKIRKSIELLKSGEIEVVFRTTVVPGIVQEAQLRAIRKQLGDVNCYLVQPFRNVKTLEPMFGALKEFSLQRFEQMKAEFEVTPAQRYRISA